MPKGMGKMVERRRAAAKAAMPEVKKLVRRFGRAAVGNCLAKIRTFDKEAKRLAALRQQVRELAQKLK